MTPTYDTMLKARLRKVLALCDREAAAADKNHEESKHEHWDSYAQGVRFALEEIRAEMGMDGSDGE